MGSLTLDQRYCWVDIWAFEHVLGEADSKLKEGLTERAVHLTQKAIKMYRGAFLAWRNRTALGNIHSVNV